MKTKLITLLGLVGSSLLLLGCGTIPSPKEADSGLSTIKAEVKKITPDDPLPVFRKVFSPLGYPVVAKDPLDTTAEHAAKLAALGLADTYVFLVPPEQCKVLPYPDYNFYVIGFKDDCMIVGASIDRPPYGVTLAVLAAPPSAYDTQDKHGVQFSARQHDRFEYKLGLSDFLKLPSTLRWKAEDNDPYVRFGLPVWPTDPAFRQLLREKKIGLALRVRLGDLSQATTRSETSAATADMPVSFFDQFCYLPVTLLEAWVVDTSTQMSIVHWAAAPAALK